MYAPSAAVPIALDASRGIFRRPKTFAIDNVFADMETAFRCFSTTLATCFPLFVCACRTGSAALVTCVQVLWNIVAGLAMLPITFIQVMLLYFPSFFALLVLRPTHIETDSSDFSTRQDVIEAESQIRRSGRWIAMIARAMPVLFVLFILPIVLIYQVLDGVRGVCVCVCVCVYAFVCT